MWQYWSHIKYTTRHKYYVFIECFKRGLIVRGLMHDLSKYTSSEFTQYANFFFNADGSRKPDTHVNSVEIKIAFDEAWKHHQLVNNHHWQYWIVDDKVIPIPKDAVDEMICDWIGAAKANYQNEPDIPLPWYKQNRLKIRIHDDTRKYIEEQIGFKGDV